MKQILALVLLVATLLSFCACQNLPATQTQDNATQTQTEAQESKTEDSGETSDRPDSYPVINNTLTWDKINAIPVAKAGMTTDELRQICLDLFRLTQTFQWTPAEDYTYKIQTNSVTLKSGKVLAGLPYVAENAGGSIYSFLQYYNSETGLLELGNLNPAAIIPSLGTHCSSGAFWGWARVVNSTIPEYRTVDIHHANGFLRVGPYQYVGFESATSWNREDNLTTACCKANGKDVMFSSYAQLKPADGLLLITKGGMHVRMIVSVHVEYNAGKIDGEKSYVTYLDQGSSWNEITDGKEQSFTDGGNIVYYQGGIDEKQNFNDLYKKGYVPFTYGELLGTDPIEPATAKLSVESNKLSDLQQATVTSNYNLATLSITIYDANGNEVYSKTKAPLDNHFSIRKANVSGLLLTAAAKEATKDGARTVISAYLANGETITVFDGTITK